eukprot:UN06489
MHSSRFSLNYVFMFIKISYSMFSVAPPCSNSNSMLFNSFVFFLIRNIRQRV